LFTFFVAVLLAIALSEYGDVVVIFLVVLLNALFSAF
jgi:hypothetical protein